MSDAAWRWEAGVASVGSCVWLSIFIWLWRDGRQRATGHQATQLRWRLLGAASAAGAVAVALAAQWCLMGERPLCSLGAFIGLVAWPAFYAGFAGMVFVIDKT